MTLCQSSIHGSARWASPLCGAVRGDDRRRFIGSGLPLRASSSASIFLSLRRIAARRLAFSLASDAARARTSETRDSPFPVAETIGKIESDLGAKGVKVFARIDHAGEAKASSSKFGRHREVDPARRSRAPHPPGVALVSVQWFGSEAKELVARGDLQRCLIVCPGSFVGRFRDGVHTADCSDLTRRMVKKFTSQGFEKSRRDQRKLRLR